MILRIAFFAVFTLNILSSAHAQSYFSVELEQMSFPNFPGFHSGAIGEVNGRWIVIGGRKNGLHGFHPPLAFPTSNANTTIYLIDPFTQQTWTAQADSLPVDIREAVTSSNMLFSQRDSVLYMLGGYGWSQSYGNFKTFHTLTAVNLHSLEQAITSGTSLNSSFRQIGDSLFAVCGAHMKQMDSTFYVVWGHRFDGIYNRVDSLGFFQQNYTYQVRRMKITDDGNNLSVQWLSPFTDSTNFRRRDYNLVPQVFQDGSFGFTGFTGVFQKDVVLPFLNVVDIHSSGFQVQPGFQQLLNQYHSAVMPVYDSVANTMHSVFFGGSAQYFIDSVSHTMVEDTVIPFVNTISKVSRDATGNFSESYFPIRMPGLLGTNSEFIPSDSVSLIRGSIIRLNPITTRTFAGYIIGGIESPDPNINASDPSVSIASPKVFKVYIVPSLASTEEVISAPFSFHIFPNPASGSTQVRLNAKESCKSEILLYTAHGQLLQRLGNKEIVAGENLIEVPLTGVSSGTYIIRVRSGAYAFAQPLIVN